jgi:phosphatidylserine decarboxylase
MMRIRHEVGPFVAIVVAVSTCVGLFLNSLTTGCASFSFGTAFLLFFFRDPERMPPLDSSLILSGADGRVMSVTRLAENTYLKTECVRISVFLSIFDVHVNRSPITGNSKFLGYFPGEKLFAFREKSSELNQHNKILIDGLQTQCLVAQIVGPVARRVVYWLDPDASVPVKAGDRIGMMKFGSRLDVYLPSADVDVLIKPGDRVRTAETVIAKIRRI